MGLDPCSTQVLKREITTLQDNQMLNHRGMMGERPVADLELQISVDAI